ncbi:MAG: sugar phosphate isomerase/epimerase [Chloroflexi bacterium]|nr:sugar phosphate isomerase/epimerase [Chloroflexota bacterium]
MATLVDYRLNRQLSKVSSRMNPIAIACKHENFENCLALAATHGIGLEIQSFAFPPLLNDDEWEGMVAKYANQLQSFSGTVALHGAFMDMAPGSPDKSFLDVTRQRTLRDFEIAHRLNTKIVNFHANFIATIHNDDYREGWTKRMVEFYKPIAREAEKMGLCVVLENMWEFDPSIIRRVLEEVGSSALAACLDIGHSQLFSHLLLEDWLQDLNDWIAHIHINNNYGEIDEHLALDDGVLDYEKILPRLAELPRTPTIVLEIERIEDIEHSLSFFKLPHSEKS